MNIETAILKITFASVWSKAWPILVAILFFGLIIAIHEFGHFITAKLCKVKVHEFSIGMGPAIIKKQFGETLYALRLLPVGGYVRMEGEDEASDDERAFCNKKPWQKFLIVAAGAFNNLVLGLILVGVMTCSTDLIGTRQVHSFHENASSHATGLEAGDVIKKINGTRIFSSRDIDYALVRDKDGVYDFVVDRGGETVALHDVTFEMQEYAEGKNTIIFDFILVGEHKTVWNVIKTTFMDTISIARLVWLSLFDLVTGRYGLNDLSGPVGAVSVVAQVTSEAVSSGAGLEMIVYIMALITINIGVFNWLPIPALDGGRLMFIIIEWIRGKPIDSKYEGWVHTIGFILLMIFMVVITFNDIKNLITGAL